MSNEVMVQLDKTLNVDREFKVIPDSLGHRYALEATDVVYVDGKRFRLVERKANVGEKVVVIEEGTHVYSAGDITEIIVVNEGNDRQTRRGNSEMGWLYDYEYRVLEPVDQAPQSTEDLIANLVRRVASLESQLRDTQNNVERQGVEIANLEAATKAPQSGAKLLAEAFEALAKYERSVGR